MYAEAIASPIVVMLEKEDYAWVLDIRTLNTRTQIQTNTDGHGRII